MKKYPATGGQIIARRLRRNMTEAEKAIWHMLRSRQIDGHHFRRQVPLGRYVADFACHESRLIIEIDGGQHDPASAQQIERSQFLEEQGYRVLRFWNNDVLENAAGVWTAIATALGERHPHPTLPHRGGGLLEWRRLADLSVAELYELLRFRQAIFVVEQASPYVDLDGLDQPALHLMLRCDAVLVGYLRLIPYPQEARVAIGRVAVATGWRRRGLARAMMQEALARSARHHPGSKITVSAQAYLVPFYEALGFVAVSPPYDDFGVPHVDMERRPDG